MSTTQSPPPTNYNWVGNTLTYSLDPTVKGVKIQYQKSGESNWHVLVDEPNASPSNCILLQSLGPQGTVFGLTRGNDPDKWGPPGTEEITNNPS